MFKRYLSAIIVATILSIALNSFNKLQNSYEDTIFNIEHDYSSIAKNLWDDNSDGKGTPSASTPVPSTDASLSSVISKKNYNKLMSDIKKYLSKQQGTYGIYFLDLTNGQKAGLNASKQFIAASTIKVPINLYLYSKYSKKAISLEDTVTYEESDYEEGTGNIQYEDFGNNYTLRDLAERSIEISDNVAIKMLSRSLGYENVLKYMERLVNHAIPRDENVTSPRDMAIYFKSILDLTQKHEETQELLEFLLNTQYNDRIPLYLPQEIPIAHKIGTSWDGAVNDAGIVFAKRPYILCIFSENVDIETAPEVLANISKMVYEYTQN